MRSKICNIQPKLLLQHPLAASGSSITLICTEERRSSSKLQRDVHNDIACLVCTITDRLVPMTVELNDGKIVCESKVSSVSSRSRTPCSARQHMYDPSCHLQQILTCANIDKEPQSLSHGRQDSGQTGKLAKWPMVGLKQHHTPNMV